MAQIGATWVSTSWVSAGGWADGTWGASTAATETVTGAGGILVRERGRSRRLEPLTVTGRYAPVDGTLYRQMFPEQPAEPKSRTDTLAPALLLAWMTAFDD